MNTKISINNIVIDIVRKDIKNLHLAVYPPEGRIRIASPQRMSDDALRLFAISKIPWIKKHQASFKEQQRQTIRQYITGESHYLKGSRYRLNVIEQKAPLPNKVVLRNKKYIDLFVRGKSSLEQKANVLNEWYRQLLKKDISILVDKWQKKIGVEVTHWGVKQMKTKWGSCNTDKKNIWLNLELAKKPIHCLEYIVVHELLHLIERKHNDIFISYLDKYLPNWKFLRDELNKLPVSHGDWKY